MPNSVLNLQAMSCLDLLQLFKNAVSLIGRGKQVETAEKTILDIQTEWKQRRVCGGAFTYERPETGMLAALGYHVGHAEGRPQTERREILKFVLSGELPMVYSASYTDEWGEPGSYKRYGKLIRGLQTYIGDNQSRPGMKLAVRQWSEDLAWVEQFCDSSEQS